ncbi:MAG: 2-hydroxyacid dehydrogenase [Eubacteriales bacterium]|nr:2-hydroxyacid dehydrogenase [Eubacteriales bacterium]
MTRKTILLTNHYDAAPLQIVKENCPPDFRLLYPDDGERSSLLSLAAEADYLLVSGRQRIDEALLQCAHRLKMVQRTGVGIDMLDLEALQKHALPLYINAGVNAQSVAEYTLLLILNCLRQYPKIHAQLQSGIWKKQANGIRTHELKGKRVGLAGLGRIGRKTAALLQAFGAHVAYYDLFRNEEAEKEMGIVFLPWNELLAQSQILSLHCPLTEQTKRMVNADALAAMREDAVLINTARGALIDQEALFEALHSHRIAGAAIDVFEQEPLPPDSRLLQLDNLFVSPHIGGITRESFSRMMQGAFSNIRAFDRGELQQIESSRYSF